VLFSTVQIQYWLHQGVVDFGQMDFRTLTAQALNWLALAVVYQWRSYHAGHSVKIYRWLSKLLLVFVGLVQLQISVFDGPFFQFQPLGDVPVFNMLLLLWGAPAALCWWLSTFAEPNPYRWMAQRFMAGFALLFLIATIRHYWQQGQISLSLTTSVAEQYSYSVVFLLMALLFVLLAQYKRKPQVRKLGFATLAAVVLKVFIVDLSHLDGILRALSFIGLGLSLVMLGWLFQRFRHYDASASQVE